MRRGYSFVLAGILGLTLAAASGCSPTKTGMENRAAANERMSMVGAQVHFEQSKQHFATGQLDKALKEIDRAIERFPEHGDYHLLKGRVLLEQARLEQSLACFTTALEKNPRLADAQYYAGIVYQRWSDDRQAHTCYLQAYTIEPDKVHYLLAAAESLVALGEYAQAAELIEPKLAYFEHNASLRQLQAQIAMLQGDARKAAEVYAEARLLNPEDQALLEEMMWAQWAAGMYAQCHESTKTVQALSEQPRTEIVHLEARCLAMMGRGVEARVLYLQLSKSRPADASVWAELGTLSWELGDYRSLAQASTQMLAIAPDRYEGYLFRAVNERHKGNTQEAIRLFREASERAGNVALPHLILGQALEQAGDNDGARLAYNDALRADPNSAEAMAILRRFNNGQQVTVVPEQ